MAKPLYILLFGPQGSGKGTQAERLGAHFGIPAFGAGQLLRQEVRAGTAMGKELALHLRSGTLVPVAMTNAVVFRRVERDDTKKGFILDGYPRDAAQEKALRSFLVTLRGGTAITHAINLALSDVEGVKRLSGRRTCTKCGKIYHIKTLRPKKEGVCDNCGSPIVQRDDDQPKAIRERLRIYHAETAPLLEQYAKDGVLVRVDAHGSMDEVFHRIVAAIAKRD